MAVPISNNASSFFFILMDFPGLEAAHCWTAIPVCFIYALSCWATPPYCTWSSPFPSLRRPMYLFLSMLSVADLGLTAPTLAFHGSCFSPLGQRKVGAATCFVQLFFIHTCSVIESASRWPWLLTAAWLSESPYAYATILTAKRIRAIDWPVWPVVLPSTCPCLYFGRLRFPPVNALSIFLLWFNSWCSEVGQFQHSCEQWPWAVCDALHIGSGCGPHSPLLCDDFEGSTEHCFQCWRLKALNTCISHICAVLLFYTPLVSLSVIHRFGKKKLPAQIYMLLSYLHFLYPPVLNPVVYTVKTKEIRAMHSEDAWEPSKLWALRVEILVMITSLVTEDFSERRQRVLFIQSFN